MELQGVMLGEAHLVPPCKGKGETETRPWPALLGVVGGGGSPRDAAMAMNSCAQIHTQDTRVRGYAHRWHQCLRPGFDVTVTENVTTGGTECKL